MKWISMAMAIAGMGLVGMGAGGCVTPGGSLSSGAMPVAAPSGVDAMLSEGTAAPDVSALGMRSKPVHLSEFRGKLLVLFFYPMDFAAGATAEVKEFRDDQAKYNRLGVATVGVSMDDVDTHREFAQKNKLPFPLLSDVGGELARAFRVPVEGGTPRHATFLVDRGGVIRHVWKKVRPWGHSAEVLSVVQAIAARR
jgi:thioredoxin-dependent peroxiredoxin